jgi:hypothetical protein
MHVEIKETEAYPNASDICYILIVGFFIIISGKYKLPNSSIYNARSICTKRSKFIEMNMRGIH